MKLDHKLQIIIATLMLLSSGSALAIMPGAKSLAQTPQSAATNAIERGGSITAINLTKGIISVDQKAYPFSPGTTPITYRDTGRAAPTEALRQGIKIEFSTKTSVGRTEQIESIQIVGGPK